mmetsp:Transcript_21705/g.39836  ORF Transcript_21705/g.39836 Transcript_21705/m.39836 type:complete len:730 (-) Transcript_21705:200-2389(-)
MAQAPMATNGDDNGRREDSLFGGGARAPSPGRSGSAGGSRARTQQSTPAHSTPPRKTPPHEAMPPRPGSGGGPGLPAAFQPPQEHPFAGMPNAEDAHFSGGARAPSPNRSGSAGGPRARAQSGPTQGTPQWKNPPPREGTPPQRPGSGFPSGQDHPLAGVPNAEELDEPEPLEEGGDKDIDVLLDSFGDYLTRCFCSKAWNLRDAALQKLNLDLQQGGGGVGRRSLVGYTTVLQRTLPDRSVQVLLSSCSLLHAMCYSLLHSPSLGKAEASGACEPLGPLLVDRVGDANTRVDKNAKDALLGLAGCSSLGGAWVAQHLLRPLRKRNVHARVYSARLQLLTALAQEHGMQPGSRSGLPQEETLQLAMEWFNNPAAEVRESAVKLVAACHTHLGLEPLEPHLSKLRAAQREVFEIEFQRAAREAAVPKPHKPQVSAALPGGSGRSRESKSPPGGAMRGMGFQPSPRGMSWDPPVELSASMTSRSGYPTPVSPNGGAPHGRSVPAAPSQLARTPPPAAAPQGASNDDEYGDPGPLMECPDCGRRFKAEVMEKHAAICKKVFQQKRKQFNSAANRLGDLENAGALIANAQKIGEEKERTAAQAQQTAQPTKAARKEEEDASKMPEWKKKSLAFRSAILRAKGASGDAQAEAEAQAMEKKLEAAGGADSNMTKCPHCGRTFNKEAAERHIPICLKTFGSKAGGGRLPKGGGLGAHAGKGVPTSVRGASAQRGRS